MLKTTGVAVNYLLRIYFSLGKFLTIDKTLVSIEISYFNLQYLNIESCYSWETVNYLGKPVILLSVKCGNFMIEVNM